MKHNMELFDRLLTEAIQLNANSRKGNMFGSPAIYVGRKMCACVHGNVVGLRVPEEMAMQALSDPTITPFQPHGKSKMREWIQIGACKNTHQKWTTLLNAALSYGEANNG